MKAFVKGVALTAALYLCAGFMSSSARAPMPGQRPQERRDSKPLSPEELARTRRLFEEHCARCHGPDGRGKTSTGQMLEAPDFTDEEWWKEDRSDKRLVTSVTEGRDAMPPFGKKLSREEIAALVAYVRRFHKAARE